jgi:hypothetical protein
MLSHQTHLSLIANIMPILLVNPRYGFCFHLQGSLDCQHHFVRHSNPVGGVISDDKAKTTQKQSLSLSDGIFLMSDKLGLMPPSRHSFKTAKNDRNKSDIIS